MLKHIAVVVGAVALGGGGYFTVKIQSRIANEEYYKKSLSMLRKYKPAVDMFGQPIKSKWLDLGNTEANNLDGLKSRLAIPVKGPQDKGTLFMWASRDKPGTSWTIDRLDLEVKSSGQKWTFYKNTEASS